jgi:hypothetical protein
VEYDRAMYSDDNSHEEYVNMNCNELYLYVEYENNCRHVHDLRAGYEHKNLRAGYEHKNLRAKRRYNKLNYRHENRPETHPDKALEPSPNDPHSPTTHQHNLRSHNMY